LFDSQGDLCRAGRLEPQLATPAATLLVGWQMEHLAHAEVTGVADGEVRKLDLHLSQKGVVVLPSPVFVVARHRPHNT